MTTKVRLAPSMVMNGTIVKTARSVAVGMMSSFWMNLSPSASVCAQPW